MLCNKVFAVSHVLNLGKYWRSESVSTLARDLYSWAHESLLGENGLFSGRTLILALFISVWIIQLFGFNESDPTLE